LNGEITVTGQYDELKEIIISGNQAAAIDIVKKMIDSGEEPKKIMDVSLVPAMDTVGEKFQNNEFFIPELLVAARAMEGALAVLQPLLAEGDSEPTGKFLIGTVKGDLHDIGKNIVSAMMKGAGFEIIDLGVDVDSKKFAQKIEETNPDIVGISALLTTTMREMKDTIQQIESAGLRNKVKIMVGGAPLTQEYADEIGADAFGKDAAEAVKKAKALIGK